MAQWWHFRNGWKEVFSHLCSIGLTCVRGTDSGEVSDSMDPDGFERELKRDFGEAACHALKVWISRGNPPVRDPVVARRPEFGPSAPCGMVGCRRQSGLCQLRDGAAG